MTWQLFFLLYVVFISVYSQVAKFALRDARHDGAAMVLLQLFGVVPLFFVLPFFEFKFSSDWRLYFLLAFSLIFYALSDRFQATGRKHLTVSLYALLLQSYNIFLFIFGIIFYQESVTSEKLLGFLLVVLGNFVLLYRRGKFVFNKYVFVSLLSAFFLAMAVAIDVGNSQNFSLPFYIVIIFLVPGLLIKIFERISCDLIIKEFSPGRRKFFLVAGVTWGLASLCYYIAVHKGGVTNTSALDGGTTMLNVVLSFIIFRQEESDRLRKLIAGLLIVLGVIFVL